eukprot:CAMPEP_0197174458 /NCGR_PEP_ID=MMETSP1423-20130617/969_1 /TAXON_ID=476441 /ORGANISM="Pseudo-nitzschia heimii, Strain UNC1101" /LENGTH=1238 /DNA_ID=CAMNT_0042623391 /DNA_START=138 /DNA_END=3854 /DNA_ORIENTATION=-
MADHPRIQHRYHALPAVATEDGEGDDSSDIVWDQLNDEQSREVQQHESRFRNGDRFGRDNPVSIAWSIANQATNSAGHAVRQTAEKAKVAVREWQQNQRNNHDSNERIHRRPGGFMDPNDMGDDFDLQFGIQDLFRRGGESTLSQEAVEYNNNCANNNPGSPTHNGKAARTVHLGGDAEERPLKGYPFVVLEEGRDVPERNDYNMHNTHERDRWGIVSNLDVFLTHMYKYYYHRGLTPMLCSFFVETSSLLFTIWLTRLLLIGVDWPKLLTMNCDEAIDGVNGGEQEDNVCHSHLSDYARSDPLGWTSYVMIQGYTFLLLGYAFFKSWVFYHDFFGYAIQCRTILHDKLGLSERKLQGGSLSWNEVVTKLAEGQESGTYKIIQHHTNAAHNVDSHAHEAKSHDHLALHSIPEVDQGQEQIDEKPEAEEPHRKPVSGVREEPHPRAPPAAAFDLPKNPSKLQQHRNQSLLDPLQIAQRIMRKENFLLAFWNAGLLECTKVVFPWSAGDGAHRHYWCGVLEWSFYQCVLNFMFNHKYELRPAFCLDSDALKRRLKVCGIVHLFLLPFLLVFVVLHFFLGHVYNSKMDSPSSVKEKRGGGGIMGSLRWSSAATWQFREFNELPHAFERRMEPSYEAAWQYCKLFGTSEYLAAIGRLLVFFGGAIGGILFVLGVVVNDALLLHVQLWGRNLVWYAGMAGIVYTIGKALEPTKEATPHVSKNIFEDMDYTLKNLSQHTHYYPEHWKGRGWDGKVYSSFKLLFDSEVKLFLHELIALILTPYILYFKLSEKAPDICEFCLVTKAKLVLSANSSIVNGGSGTVHGDVCGFSTFDFDTFGDEAWEGRTLGRSAMLQRQREQEAVGVASAESLTESILRTGNLEEATRLHPKPRARHGKMEKSFFTFKAAHPDWNSCFPPSGQSLVNRVEEYRLSTEIFLISRERELHVQAARRQLETLARIEEEQRSRNSEQNQRMELPTMIHWKDEHYARSASKVSLANGTTGSSKNGSLPFMSPLSANTLDGRENPNHEPRQSASLQSAQQPSTLPSTIQNAMRPHIESLTSKIEDIPSSLPLSSTTGNQVARSSIREMSLSFSPSNSVSTKSQQIQTSRQISGDDSIHRQHDCNTEKASVNSSSSEIRPFESQNGTSVSSNSNISQHQRGSFSRSGLTSSTSGKASSLQADTRGSQNQYQWLERFHEHLEIQEREQEDVQHNQRQRHWNNGAKSSQNHTDENKDTADDGGTTV